MPLTQRGKRFSPSPSTHPEGHKGEGWGGCGSTTSQTQRARELRRRMTDAERRLWRELRLRQFAAHKFRRQFPIGPYVVDFICLDARLIIEVDGGQHLDSARDDRRDAWLAEQGFRVVRFWNNDVMSKLQAVLDDIWWQLHPHPGPTPSRYRESLAAHPSHPNPDSGLPASRDTKQDAAAP